MDADTRIALQAEIEHTREKFQRFLITIPEEALQCPSKDSAWTNAEILYKISISPLVIPSILKRNFGTWSHLVIPRIVTGSLLVKSKERFIRSHAGRATLRTFADEYQLSCNEALKILDGFLEKDFKKTLSIMEPAPLLSGQVTVEQLFHYVKNYFDTYRPLVDVEI
jgi:hypothetical protein